MNTQIKTIDVQAKEWFDKSAGNSYFSAIITLNFGLDGEKHINVPFQYGHDSQYEHVALHMLQTECYIPTENVYRFSEYCRDNGIVLRMSKKDNCLKREVKNWAY